MRFGHLFRLEHQLFETACQALGHLAHLLAQARVHSSMDDLVVHILLKR